MARRFFILARHKITTLERGTGDLILEDIIDIASEQSTKIVDDEDLLDRMKKEHPDLRYSYVIHVTTTTTGTNNG